jgi:AraC-like DNA-binding protein
VEIAESLLSPPPGIGRGLVAADPDLSFIRRFAAYRAPLRFHVADPANRCDAFAVSPGMVMAVVDVGCKNEFSSRLSGQDIVEFHFRLSGSLVLAGDWGEVSVGEASCLLWYQPVGCDDVAERLGVPDEFRETWVSLYCDRAWLSALGGAPVEQLLAGLEAARVMPSAPQFRLCPQIGATVPILRDIVALECRDGIDWLHAIAKAHELLHATLRNARALIDWTPHRRPLGGRERRCVAQARGALEAGFVDPPSLGELAGRVGLSASGLCEAFHAEYGETTAGFVRRLRLEHAHALLRRTDLQVREVARLVGYRHHSTFTAAFARHFGFPPKRSRRGEPVVN